MEPHIDNAGNQIGGTDQNQSSAFNKLRPKKKGRSTLINLIIIISPIFVIFYLFGPYFIFPLFTPGKIHGSFMDAAVIPQKDGSQRIWVLTDGSLRFLLKSSNNGGYSVEQKCLFCKTVTYIYDPAAEKIINKIETPLADAVMETHLTYSNGKVWAVTKEHSGQDPEINVYDAETTEKVMDTKAFIAKYTLLSAGLISVKYEADDNTYQFKTKDGREYVTFSIEKEKMYADGKELKNELETATGDTVYCVLSPTATSQERKNLFRINGSKKILSFKQSLYSDVRSEKWLAERNATAAQIGGKDYLEGIIYYQDQDIAIVIHLEQLGPKSGRYMTCIDVKTGKEKWIVGADQMFEKMRINENKDAFSSLFFSKDDIIVKRTANVAILEFKDYGIMAFDLVGGKKLWTLDI